MHTTVTSKDITNRLNVQPIEKGGGGGFKDTETRPDKFIKHNIKQSLSP